jgi:hypothetical protein
VSASFAELSAPPQTPAEHSRLVVEAIDSAACRQRADDYCDLPHFLGPTPAPPVSEPATALMFAAALVIGGVKAWARR